MVHPLRLAVVLLAFAALCPGAAAQIKEQTINPQSTCSRESALSIIDRQIDLSKTIDSDAKRITLTLRAADLMWPVNQARARTTFIDAFDVASRLFKEKGAADTRDGRSYVQGIDYRYKVITAIARRDSAWARKLSQQILDEAAAAATAKAEDQATKEKSETNPQATRTSEDLMNVAPGFAA